MSVWFAGDVQYTGGLHEYSEGISCIHPGDTMISMGKVIEKTIESVWKPRCTEHPLVSHDIPYTHHGIPPAY